MAHWPRQAALTITGVTLLAGMAAQAEMVVFDAAVTSRDITPVAFYWLDASGSASVEDVAALVPTAFTPIDQHVSNLGMSRHPVWVRFTVYNANPKGRWILEYTNPRTNRVDLYVPLEGGGFIHKQAGASYPFYARELYHASPAFLVDTPRGHEQTFFLRLDDSGNLRFSLVLWEAGAFHRYAATANIASIALFGMITAIALFNMCVYFSLRERAYLYLALLVVCFLFTHLSVTGLGAMLFWPDAPWLGERGPTVFMLLTFMVGAFFASSLAAPGEAGRRWNRAGLLVGGLASVCVLLAAVAPGVARAYLLTLMALVVPGYILLLGADTWRRNLPYARLFLVAWGSMGVVTLFVALLFLRLFSVPVQGELVFSITFVAASLLWSFVLTGRLKQRDEEVRALLESRVRERSQKLASALSEVKALTGLLPICAGCRKVRDDTGYWRNVEAYLEERAEVNLSHGICPECTERFYPEFAEQHQQDRPGGG